MKDVAAAILWALRSVQSVNKLYNLGAGIRYTNYEIAEAVNRAFGNPVPIRYLDEENEGITSSVMDVSRMGADGFTARYGLDMALADIFTEYRERMENGEK